MADEGEQYPENFFYVNKCLLRFGGIWPSEKWSRPVQVLYRIYTIIVFLGIQLFFTATELATLFYAYHDIYTIIQNVNFFLTQVLSIVYVVLWFLKKHILLRLMAEMGSDKFRYEHCEGFRPSKILQEYKRSGIRYTLTFFLMACATTLSLYIPPMYVVLVHTPPYGVNGSSFYENLPYKSWMPFNYYKNPVRYILGLCYQFGAYSNFLLNAVGLDMLFVNILNLVAAHFTILQGAFTTIGTRVTMKLPNLHEDNEKHALMYSEMRKCCCHLQMILRVCDDIEMAYKVVTLIQALSILFILCTSQYLLSMASPDDKMFLIQIFYMVAITIKLYAFCWFANEVTLKAQDIPMFLWKGDWLGSDRKFKQAMIFTMARMNKPIHMTLGQFAPLTLETFVAVIKGSYSLFALLQNADSQEQ